MFVFDDESDFQCSFEPIIEGETVEAVVQSFGKMGPFRRARIPTKRAIVWSIYVSRDCDVVAYKSTRKRWIKLKPGVYVENGSRPSYNLARDPLWSGGHHAKFYAYELLDFAGWVQQGRKRKSAVVMHSDENVANNDCTNLVRGTRSSNGKGFRRHRALGTLPMSKPVPVYISRATKERLMRSYSVQGDALHSKVEEMIVEQLDRDFPTRP